MGTRGIMAFAHNGEVKAMYNHWDSYPTGLGNHLQAWMLDQNGDFSKAIELFDRLVAVSEDVKPTEDQKVALLKYADLGVSTRSPDEWYVLLRETQGDPAATLMAGFYIDSFDFGFDSLFCEWAYVVDLDRKVLEVYKGWSTETSGEGRWVREDPEVAYDGTKYYGVSPVAEFTLDQLADPNLMTDFEQQSYNEDDE